MKDEWGFTYLNASQLVKHALGLLRAATGGPVSLLYLFWELYVYYATQERCAYISGLRFREFLPIVQARRIVLWIGGFDPAMPLQRQDFHCLSPVEAEALLQTERSAHFSDLLCVDVSGSRELDDLSDPEWETILAQAEGRRPKGKPCLKALQNTFAYVSHDDGWYAKVYLRPVDGISDLISRVLIGKVEQLLGSVLPPIDLQPPSPMTWTFKSLARRGMYIDLASASVGSSGVDLSLYLHAPKMAPALAVDMDATLNSMPGTPETKHRLHMRTQQRSYTVFDVDSSSG